MEYKKYVGGLVEGAIGMMFAGSIAWIAYNGVFSKTIDDVTVTSVGNCQVDFYHEGWSVSESSPMMRVDKYDDCLRSVDLLTQDIKVGDKLKSLSYRSPLFGNCKVLTEIVKEK